MRPAAVLPALLLLSACPKKNATALESDEVFLTQVKESLVEEEGLILQEVDLDKNGKPDILNYFRERSQGSRLLVRKKVDLNLDGKIDVVSHFDDLGALEREEMDSDFDGAFDWTDHYQGGIRVMSEMDSNYDGRPDIYFYYAKDEAGKPRIDRKERDTDANGMIDYWERFDATGKVIKTGRDTDGDGKMDERDE